MIVLPRSENKASWWTYVVGKLNSQAPLPRSWVEHLASARVWVVFHCYEHGDGAHCPPLESGRGSFAANSSMPPPIHNNRFDCFAFFAPKILSTQARAAGCIRCSSRESVSWDLGERCGATIGRGCRPQAPKSTRFYVHRASYTEKRWGLRMVPRTRRVHKLPSAFFLRTSHSLWARLARARLRLTGEPLQDEGMLNPTWCPSI